ncbi:MAG TPA: FlgO family outer membrane protein [Myxococcus sp.]|nr:FlgO family outer membrane protein [Myxococcus sp.]
MSAILRWPLLLLLVFASLAAAAPPQGPVAVMPFRNLNGDPTLDWLGRGMAETLVSDLRASGKLQVVEREQLDRVLSELERQERQAPSDATAARVGRLVGARTLVLGSFQRAGRQVRINARFIAVETGEVLGTAKATGPMERVFPLQDEVVARLLGTPPRPASGRPTGAAVVRAYERYGRALSSPSEEERARLLREALAESPGFPYAQAELARLEQRLQEHARKARPARDAREAELRALVDDTARPAEERSAAALRLLDTLSQRGRWSALLRDAEHLARLELPPYQGRLPAEEAAWRRVDALRQREEWGPVMEAGEAFLRKYPGSPHAPLVDSVLRSTAIIRAAHEQQRRELQSALAAMEQEAAKELARLEQQGAPTEAGRRDRDEERCTTPAAGRFHAEAAVACRAYSEAWSPGSTERERAAVRNARVSEIAALVALRRYAEARERFAAFQAADPEGLKASNAGSLLLAIPPDEGE